MNTIRFGFIFRPVAGEGGDVEDKPPGRFVEVCSIRIELNHWDELDEPPEHPAQPQ
jgi:hypothetical protein